MHRSRTCCNDPLEGSRDGFGILAADILQEGLPSLFHALDYLVLVRRHAGWRSCIVVQTCLCAFTIKLSNAAIAH